MRLLTLLLFPLFLSLYTSETGQIKGTLVEQDSQEPLIGATITFTDLSGNLTGSITDIDGKFEIQLPANTYTIEFSYTGYNSKKIKNIRIEKNQTQDLGVIGLETGALLEECVVTALGGQKMSKRKRRKMKKERAKIRNLPTRNINAIAATPTGISTSNIQAKGSRTAATSYYIDGVQVNAHGQNVNAGNTIAKDSIDVDFSKESYNEIIENPFIQAEQEAISTFSIDVDAAAYSNVRRYLQYGQLPPKDAVRIEELINYFPYDYAPPTDGKPFAVHTELADCPWNTKHRLLRIALKGQNIDAGQLPTSNLVFLIDVSGSMSAANKLPLVKESLKLLTSQMRAQDKVSIVVYAGAAGLVLPPTSGQNQAAIISALDKLQSGGSTAGGAGIELAYKTAKANFQKNGNNRVILCTDGDFNVGTSDQKGLDKLIEQERKSGVYLTVLGFGMGNYQDGKMQSLADKGNGNHAYIDSQKEAHKILVKEFGGTMYAIAKDVKLQLIFNPKAVQSYRLIGYENRLLATEDFDDDSKDAGELGVGHTVTALYEIVPAHKDRLYDDLLTLKMRYKKPKKGKDKNSFLIEHSLSEKPNDTPSEDFIKAATVAEFGLLLRDSKYKGSASWKHLKKTTAALHKAEHTSEVYTELADLVEKAAKLNN